MEAHPFVEGPYNSYCVACGLSRKHHEEVACLPEPAVKAREAEPTLIILNTMLVTVGGWVEWTQANWERIA